jgi:hypothetical protein
MRAAKHDPPQDLDFKPMEAKSLKLADWRQSSSKLPDALIFPDSNS